MYLSDPIACEELNPSINSPTDQGGRLHPGTCWLLCSSQRKASSSSSERPETTHRCWRRRRLMGMKTQEIDRCYFYIFYIFYLTDKYLHDSTIRFKHQSNPQFLMLSKIWFWWWNIALPDTARPWPLRSGEEPDFGPTNQVIQRPSDQRLGHAKCLNRCLVLNLLIILKPYETIKFWTQQVPQPALRSPAPSKPRSSEFRLDSWACHYGIALFHQKIGLFKPPKL